MKVGILGSGTMGTGIAQVAAVAGCEVRIFDVNKSAQTKSFNFITKMINRKVEKGNLSDLDAQQILGSLYYIDDLSGLDDTDLVIEAVVENFDVKMGLLQSIQSVVGENCIIATNTSSLSVTSLAGTLDNQSRFIGIHFFNPAPLMKLVEIVPAEQTNSETIKKISSEIVRWGKTIVIAKDTPGFIVNRLARPFYGEALRILDEGIADHATIDWAMTEIGGFRLGPFRLMDLIGNDVNYSVTESVFKAFYYDPRYKPSFTQLRMIESGRLGKKTGKGFYDYLNPSYNIDPQKDVDLGNGIFSRILVMLFNEAADAYYLKVATARDLDIAMKTGVNYPRGLLEWLDEYGIQKCVAELDALYDTYREDRYRCSPILRKYGRENKRFYQSN